MLKKEKKSVHLTCLAGKANFYTLLLDRGGYIFTH